jgi:hypothetical protein
LYAGQLQVVEAEQVGQRAVGAGQYADDLIHRRPVRALAAEGGGIDSVSRPIRVSIRVLGRVAAGLVAGVGGGGEDAAPAARRPAERVRRD